jgi:ABC-type antimicrobial peptide transport system permease subunit
VARDEARRRDRRWRGLLLAIPVAFVLRALIVGVSPVDPASILPAIGLTLAGAAAASLAPARRAARVDPNVALRDL